MIAGLELLSHGPRSRLERDLVGSVLRKKIERAAAAGRYKLLCNYY